MKQELTQMAFNFPTEAEPQAAPQNVISPGETAAREEARRAGLGLRIKSMKNGAPLPTFKAEPVPLPAPSPKIARAEPSQRAEPAQPVVPKPEPVVYIGPTLFPLPPEEPATAVTSAVLHEQEPAPATPAAPVQDQPRPAPMPEPPPLPGGDPEIISESSPEIIPQSQHEPEPFVAPTREYKKAPAAAAAPEKPKSKRGRKSLKQITAEADLIEIPADEVLFSKQYYTMGEVAEMFRVNQSLLRFWETEFNILQPRKNKKGDRHFRPVDIKNLHLIYHLLRQRKYTIEGAKEFLKTNKKPDQRFEAIQRLQQIKAFLLELKAQL